MERIGAKELRAGIIGAYNNLEKNKELVNSLNVFPVPDGDTGTNMGLTMKSVMKKLQDSEDTVKSVAKALGTGSLMGARGNSGVILSQLCRGVTTVFENLDEIGCKEIAEACQKAKETAYKAVLKPTEGTVLTVSRLMADFAMQNFINYKDVDVFVEDIIKEGNRALDMTPEMLPVLKEAEVVDAGGKGLMVLLEGFYGALTGKDLVYDSAEFIEATNLHVHAANKHENLSSADIKYGYCTEFLINHDGSHNYEDFKKEISGLGDSLVVVGADNLIKAHIHTNHPGKVLELALARGYLSDIKIDNMRLQYKAIEDQKVSEKKDFGFVTISVGEGFDTIFTDLGVDEIISGGQTMNPSTEDIVEAVDRINADHIFVFPNNKNIIMSAKQAVDLVDKDLYVIETRSIPEAFTALLSFDESEDAETNAKNMTEAIDEVKTLQVTYAVRDTKVGKLEIVEKDLIGLRDGDIVCTGKDMEKLMLDLCKQSLDDYSGLLTLYYGSDVKKEDAQALYERLEEEFSDLDVELVYGGQPLYYYIASIE